MRKLVLAFLGIIAIAGSLFLAKYMIDSNQKPKRTFAKIVKTVFTEEVNNTEIPIILTASGILVAKNKIELFSEVQGLLEPGVKPFKTGTSFTKGQSLLTINSDEFYASIQSQKSNLFNLITAVMPDIGLDYPSEFPKWEAYIKSFKMNAPTPKLPSFASDKERYFISSRGITTSYYNVKNLEIKLSKYTITAPFTGVLTEGLVNAGTLVRPGQKLGEFIDPSVYEMEVAVNTSYADLLKEGNTVTLYNLERTKSFMGKVIRINGKVDQVSQTVKVFIQVSDKALKEGMYLEADLIGKSEKDAYEISRKLLVDNSKVYVVNDTVLNLITIDPVYFNAETVVVKGIPNKAQLLSQPVPGAYDGMTVNQNNK